jgi:IS605 OrfB family transposase
VASDGSKIEAQRIHRDAQAKLAVAQRANKTKRVKAIHAQIANRREDFHHKLSTAFVRERSAIFIGNVNASGLARTYQAKSVLDAGWSAFRTMLMYKSDNAGVWFKEVNESFTTQECSACHARTGPKGLEGLSVRSWTCSVCNTVHDRDTNAAINIENRGLEWLGKEISTMLASQKLAADLVNEDSGATSTMAEAGYGLPVEGITVLTA